MFSFFPTVYLPGLLDEAESLGFSSEGSLWPSLQTQAQACSSGLF